MTDSDHVEFIRFRDHVTEVLRLRDKADAEAQILRDGQLTLQAEEYKRRLDQIDKLLSMIEHNNKEKLDVALYRSEHKFLDDKLAFGIQQLTTWIGKVQELERLHSALANSLTWLVRLLIGSVILSSLGYVASHVLVR